MSTKQATESFTGSKYGPLIRALTLGSEDWALIWNTVCNGYLRIPDYVPVLIKCPWFLFAEVLSSSGGDAGRGPLITGSSLGLNVLQVDLCSPPYRQDEGTSTLDI